MPAKPAIHLTALAGALSTEAQRLRLKSPAQIVSLVQKHIGSRYRVTGTPTILNAAQDPLKGGRRDDPQRARELNKIFRDENLRTSCSRLPLFTRASESLCEAYVTKST